MSQRAAYISRKGETNRIMKEVAESIQAFRKIADEEQELKPNATWFLDLHSGVVHTHTYSPECPKGCYGQMEECIYKTELNKLREN